MKLQSALQLIRFNKPVGTLLLWCPTAWALWLASEFKPPMLTVLYFFLGTFLMRSAGCILNDIADRRIDAHVTRTKNRPLTSGQISLISSFILLFVFLFASYAILANLPKECFKDALFAVIITSIYPFSKRFFKTPQVILGIAFSMGIPMAYDALHASPTTTMGLLWVINFLWILAYDTLYAMSDRADDLRLGIQSMAIFLGNRWQGAILTLQLLSHVLWLLIAKINALDFKFYGIWVIGLLIIGYQQREVTKAIQYHRQLPTFALNAIYGINMWVALMVSAL